MILRREDGHAVSLKVRQIPWEDGKPKVAAKVETLTEISDSVRDNPAGSENPEKAGEGER